MGATAVAPLGSGPPSRLLLTAVGVGLVLLAALVAVYVLTPALSGTLACGGTP